MNEEELGEILKMRLSEETVKQTRFGTSIQKCESFNRSLRKEKAKVFGVTFSPKTKKALQQLDRESKHHKTYQSRPEVKRRALLSRGRTIYEHSRYKVQSSGFQRGAVGSQDLSKVHNQW